MFFHFEFRGHTPSIIIYTSLPYSTLYKVASSELFPLTSHQQLVIKQARLPHDPTVLAAVDASLQSLGAVQNRLKHRNLWPVLGYTSIHGLPAVVTPYCSNGNVAQYISQHRPSQGSRLRLILGLAQAIEYLHRNGLAHRNVNPTNILVNDNGDACLADTGIFSLLACPEKIPRTWPYKSADELCTQGTPTLQEYQERDVYSFACTAYEILSGVPPYTSRPHNPYCNIPKTRRHGHLAIPRPEEITESLWKIIQGCWSNPQNRLTMADVVQELARLL